LLSHTNLLGDLLCLGAAGSDTTLGHADAVLKFALDIWTLEIGGHAVE